ncbi:MAG: hypothetical protein LBR51_07970, partial [Bacteroidales bacterium]|nr:hypothetical protein [Bacteroidales bacterium]
NPNDYFCVLIYKIPSDEKDFYFIDDDCAWRKCLCTRRLRLRASLRRGYIIESQSLWKRPAERSFFLNSSSAIIVVSG